MELFLSTRNIGAFLQKNFNNMEITINNHKNTKVKINKWPIENEAERVGIIYEGISYSLVLDEQPKLEIWSIDESNDPLDLLHTTLLPRPICDSKTVLSKLNIK